MIADLVATPLNADGLTLSKATGAARINEMEFHYPVRRFDTRELSAVIQSCSPSNDNLLRQLQVVEAERLRGYMKGFIDLVAVIGEHWYIIDYKSNWLGSSPDDYNPKCLAETIVDEAYGLQYLIYTLALHRYLQQRLPDYSYERHFGGVYYLFLRAVSPRNGLDGIHFDRPTLELISALDEYFRTGGES
jgi:exodeoxyribonuclease V beta subunit